ncbi:MAG TPA: MarR family transcriptional regulator [Gaiellaceae bacterium]|jgi:DNA-binding MarR family transcriptional regulator|nr:MarR family transcriptional regulator [Gaiellaceae bacterium]
MSRTRDELIQALNLEVRRSQNRTDAYDEAVCEALGINRTDHRFLDIIDQEPGITAGRLAEISGLTTGAVTTVLDRLERAGFARRVRDQVDRRRVRIEVTEKAQAELWPYYEPLARIGEKIKERYTVEELELLVDFLETAAALHEGVLQELKTRLGSAHERGASVTE